jgi:hypothetical protein
MPATRLPVSGYALALVVVFLVLFGLLEVLWFFIPPPGGLDAVRARAVAIREAPNMEITKMRLDHCDRLMQTLRLRPNCGGQWVWLVSTNNPCRGIHNEAAWLMVDYQSGEITYKQACGFG